MPNRLLPTAILPLACCLVAAGAPDDPGSGCGIRVRDATPVARPCPAPARTVDGAGRNGAIALDRFRGPMRVTNAYRVIETSAASSASNLVIDGLISEDITRQGIRLKNGGRFSGITLRNLRLVHVPTPNVPPDLPAGISIAAGKDVLIEDSTIRGFQMTQPPRAYWNGDGISTERGVSGVTIRNVAVLDNTDAGLDLKSTDTVLDNVYAAGNKRNVRLWAGARATTLMIGPIIRRGGFFGISGIWIKGGAARPVVSIDTLVLDMGRDGPPVTAIEIEDGPAVVTIGRCIIRSMPPGSTFLKGAGPAASIRLGPGCVIPG